jgi:hypothetical protein
MAAENSVGGFSLDRHTTNASCESSWRRIWTAVEDVRADDLAQRGAVDVGGVVEVEHQFHSALADELSDHLAKDVRPVLDSDPPVDVDDRDVANPALLEGHATSVQGGEKLGFATESGKTFKDREWTWRSLRATSRPSFVSRARYTFYETGCRGTF